MSPAAKSKKTPAKSAAKSDRAKAADVARRTIEKKTGQRAVAANFSTYPHVPSGSFAINDLIGGSLALDGKGQVCPGYPRRRISELFGPESSGKTTVALHAIAQAQAIGGLAMFLDFEHALDHKYAKKIGVSFDVDKLLLYAPNTYEEGLQILNIGLQAGVDIIVIDSVPSMVPQEDMEGKLDKEGRFGSLARAMGKNLPKIAAWLNDPKYLKRNPQGAAIIYLNQERANIGVTRGDKTKTTGGYALKFYASLRLKFTGIGKESVKRKNRFTGKEVNVPYGTVTQVKVVKNKIDARQGQTHTIFIRYGQGIDETYSLIEAAVHHGVVKKSGAFLEFKGQKIQGREKFRSFLNDNPKVFEEIRKLLTSVIQSEADDVDPEEELSDDEIMEMEFEEENSSSTPDVENIELEDEPDGEESGEEDPAEDGPEDAGEGAK